MITFAQLKAHPDLLTPEICSPIFHTDDTMTIIWEGDPGPDGLKMLAPDWMEQEAALEQIPGTTIWGGDFPAPALPRTVCTTVLVGVESGALPSPRHQPYVHGPDLPPLPAAECEPSIVAEEVVLPAPGLAGDQRRIRIYTPPGYRNGQPYTFFYLPDGQLEIEQEQRFPSVTDTLRHRGDVPPVILVLMDHADKERPEEYLISGSRNLAARRWVWESVIPYVEARYGAAKRWAVGGSNGASFAAQLALGRPDLFSGGAFYSPWHRNGLEGILKMADNWPGGGRFAISHGNFGPGEHKNLPGAYALVDHLKARQATVHFVELDGFGHNFHAWHFALPGLLRWLLEEVEAGDEEEKHSH